MLKLTHIGYTVICLNHIGPLHIQIKNSPSALSRTILDPKCLEFGTVLVRICSKGTFLMRPVYTVLTPMFNCTIATF